MTRTYYIEIDGGLTETSLPNLRRIAIDHLFLHPRERTVPVYTSHTRKCLVGTVTYTGSTPLFMWTLCNGRSRTLLRNGEVYNRPCE